MVDQVDRLARTPVGRGAGARGRRAVLHGVVYDIRTGLLKELATRIDGVDRIRSIFGDAG